MHNVVITGGSRGIGLGIARRLAASGYRALAVARKTTEQLGSAIEEAERAAPGSFHFAAFDLADTEKIPDFVKCLRKKFGPIYGLVNNAGISFDGVLALMAD